MQKTEGISGKNLQLPYVSPWMKQNSSKAKSLAGGGGGGTGVATSKKKKKELTKGEN